MVKIVDYSGEGKPDDTLSLLQKEEEYRQAKAGGFGKDVKETFALLISPRMLYIMPLIMWTGLSGAAYSGSFVPFMNKTMTVNHPDWSDNKRLSMSLFAMIPFGAAEILGGLAIGKISDAFGYQVSLKLVLLLTVVAFGTLFATIAVYSFSFLTFIMTFTWGLQDAAVSNFVNCVLAFEFESKLTPFSVFRFS